MLCINNKHIFLNYFKNIIKKDVLNILFLKPTHTLFSLMAIYWRGRQHLVEHIF